MSSIGWRMVVSEGDENDAYWMSSYPVMEASCGRDHSPVVRGLDPAQRHLVVREDNRRGPPILPMQGGEGIVTAFQGPVAAEYELFIVLEVRGT